MTKKIKISLADAEAVFHLANLIEDRSDAGQEAMLRLAALLDERRIVGPDECGHCDTYVAAARYGRQMRNGEYVDVAERTATS
jgi:hypothetical protein